MDLIRHPFLLWPLLGLFLLLLIDKVLLIPVVRENTSHYMKIEDKFYESRQDLFPEMLRDYERRSKNGEKLGVILGTSRSSEFSTKEIAKNIPGSYTYNFSAPQAGHSYHAYWLDKIIKSGVKPAFLILESGAIPRSENTNRFPLTHSLDLPFIWEHLELFPTSPDADWNGGGGFSTDDLERFLLNRLFVSYRFPLDLRAAAKNREKQIFPDPFKGLQMTTGIQIHRQVTANIASVNLENLGGLPNPHTLELPEHLMQINARAVALEHLPNPYKVSRTQAHSLRFIVETLARAQIPLLIYYPPVVSQFSRVKDEIGATKQVEEGMVTLLRAISSRYPAARIAVADVDRDSPMKCRIFFDAIHIAGRCYPELTEKLTAKLKTTGAF